MSQGRLESTRSFETSEPQGGLKHDITVYLAEIGFVDRVMTNVMQIPGKTRKTLIWGGFCLFNLFLLIFFGVNPSFFAQFLQEHLGQFFFLFLGITLLGGLIGLVVVSDVSWLKGYLPKPDPYDE
jgi:hypothetical protein